MISIAEAIGYITMAAGGGVLATTLACLSFWSASYWWMKTYKGIQKVYQLRSVWYWMDRLEKEGTHCFQKSGEEEK